MKPLLVGSMALVFLLSMKADKDATTRLILNLGDQADGGKILVAVYLSASDFEDERVHYGTSIVVEDQPAYEVELPALPDAVYGIAAFYDRNGNGKLDTNTFGIPKEPYGFAGEPASKWRKPQWDEISTQLGDRIRELTIDLKKWKDR
ncbi:MAG: DUF2141 domain-containing protein [Bacteroidota bacterium]